MAVVIEAMENSHQLQSGHQLQQQIPQNDIHSYKSKLQQYAQRAGLELPIYNITVKGERHALIFKCSVTVDNDTYESPNSFSQKKAAEQDAAKYALRCIMEKRQEIGSSIISKNTTLCKAILNEFAAKLKIGRPTYTTTMQIQHFPIPVFISKMEFMGVLYAGGPARTKRDAEHLVAHAATLSILGHSEEDSTLLEIIRSKANLFSATQLALDSSCARRPLEEGSESSDSVDDEEQSQDAFESPPPLETENDTDPPIEQLNTTSPPPLSVAIIMYVPSSFQNLKNPTTMQIQSYRVASSKHHVNSSQILIPGPSQTLATANQNDANRGCEVSCTPPQEVLVAVAPSQESSAMCGLQSTQRLSRNQRKKANKRARIDD